MSYSAEGRVNRYTAERPQVPRHLWPFCIFILVHHRENLFEEACSNHVVSNPALSKPIQICQGSDITHFDDIYGIAADGCGIVTAAPMTQSTPRARGSRQRWKPVTPDS